MKQKSVGELNAQLVSLVGENGAELLVGALRNRRSISGPELTKSSLITPEHVKIYLPYMYEISNDPAFRINIPHLI